MTKILCTICMRGGSKGVPNKNTKLINSKPLLFYTLDQAIKSKIFSKVVISSDSEKILKISKKYGADYCLKRPNSLSRDTSAKLPVVRHALISAERYFKTNFDIIFDLDATSPLRNIKDIQNTLKQFLDEKSNNLITATEANKNPFFNQIMYKRNKYNVVLSGKSIPKRRQDAPKVYDMNASIYIWKRNFLIKSNSIFTSKTSLYLMPPERSCDIDTKLDFDFVRYMLSKKT
tara:strand:+ start:177 stop:872 length:696 start_codon:yes stop_codon:yes gene_type:complete